MAKDNQMLRLFIIAQFFDGRKSGATYKEIEKHLVENDNINYSDYAFSVKTFQRDRKLLSELLNIEIKYDVKFKTFRMLEDGFEEISESLFENLLLINAYKNSEKNKDLILFEKRKTFGVEYFNSIANACKKHKVISFNYKKHWHQISSRKTIEPYGLKEFRNRWYLIGNDCNEKDFKLKIYGLDRISAFENHPKSFAKKEICLEDLFKNSFGIVTTENQKPENIIISFKGEQSAFVKSLPLHHSQKIEIDTDEKLIVSLKLVPTYDFYQELLTHAERLTIIEPQSVKNEYLRFLNIAKELNENAKR